MQRRYTIWLSALLLLAACGVADGPGAAQPTPVAAPSPAAQPAQGQAATPVPPAETAVRAEVRATEGAPAANGAPCAEPTPPERNDSGAEATSCPPQPQPGPSVVAVEASPATRICPTPDRSDDHPPALPLPTRVAGALGCITATPNEAGGQQAGPTPIQGQRTIGLPSQGQTIELRVGETFELKLGEGMDWSVEIDPPGIVGREVGQLVAGSQGVYRALAAGTARLTAVGDPVCLKANPPCGAPSFLFELTIVVR